MNKQLNDIFGYINTLLFISNKCQLAYPDEYILVYRVEPTYKQISEFY